MVVVVVVVVVVMRGENLQEDGKRTRNIDRQTDRQTEWLDRCSQEKETGKRTAETRAISETNAGGTEPDGQ
jgi:hypothetical protein